ncbi:MAG: DUF3347 domain-containing protein, partial [candidate division Zixibacteria bacterium]|nr:DUF3347 domain-containing protein [candidate division Zixibacteria bacterium]
LIPASAALITGKRAVVYVEIPSDEEPVFEGRVVELGPRAGDFYIVRSGVEEGEQIVTNGAFKIDSELQIQAQPSMMSPEDGPAMAGHNHGPADQPRRIERAAPVVYQVGTANRLADGDVAREALSLVYDAYFGIQMALADDDNEKAVAGFETLRVVLSNVEMSRFEGEAHERWMDLSGKLSSVAQTGAGASNIEAARDAFYHLSQTAIELHDTFGHAPDRSYYLTFCPMARDNKGAYWLQTVDTVYNSFYGDAMLRCGEIKQTLSSSDGTAE